MLHQHFYIKTSTSRYYRMLVKFFLCASVRPTLKDYSHCSSASSSRFYRKGPTAHALISMALLFCVFSGKCIKTSESNKLHLLDSFYKKIPFESKKSLQAEVDRQENEKTRGCYQIAMAQ